MKFLGGGFDRTLSIHAWIKMKINFRRSLKKDVGPVKKKYSRDPLPDIAKLCNEILATFESLPSLHSTCKHRL